MKKLIGIILWLPITIICLIGNVVMWIGAHASGVAIPILGVMFILAVFTKNWYGIVIIGALIILILASLFGIAVFTGELERIRNELISKID